MTTERRAVRPIDGLEDIPLPGFYDCITTQLNITTYRSRMQARLVIVSRLPSDNVELGRDFTELGDEDQVWGAAMLGLDRHHTEALYLLSHKGKGR